MRIEASAGKSTATVKVREQLADLKAPSDAILTTTSVSGQILLRSDGTFAEGSKIVVDVTTLASDRSQRDQFIKRSTLETSKYPSATFVLKRAEGLPAPLPASGEWAVKLVGDMMIHGVTKEITWDATIKRAAGGVTGKATTSFRFGDFGMQVPSVFTVLSIVDSINLQLDFVGTAA
ncbi:MAG: hypothetical protein AUH85_04370 [Chloroflexi bacterium 13_1_40CM_4_68_4]|nr:MAG: hypothetical protein AUH85_04370 [Chloroflexi bacterium 13_1_40CM_4_68_4]